MSYRIEVTENFSKEAKKLIKKYPACQFLQNRNVKATSLLTCGYIVTRQISCH